MSASPQYGCAPYRGHMCPPQHRHTPTEWGPASGTRLARTPSAGHVTDLISPPQGVGALYVYPRCTLRVRALAQPQAGLSQESCSSLSPRPPTPVSIRDVPVHRLVVRGGLSARGPPDVETVGRYPSPYVKGPGLSTTCPLWQGMEEKANSAGARAAHYSRSQ